jgi:hypothetical protein
MRTQPPPPTPPPAPAPSSTEVVTRPDPGLARGRWEAPAWVFWVLLGIVVLGAAGYLLFRMGYLTRRKAEGSMPPPSIRSRR